MPSNVRNFLLLGFLSLAIGAVSSVLHFHDTAAQAAMVGGGNFVIAVQVVTFLLIGGLLAAAGWGRQNWARWVFAILFLLGLPMSVYVLPTIFQKDLVMGATSVLQMVLQAVALFLIFTGNAKAWYRKA